MRNPLRKLRNRRRVIKKALPAKLLNKNGKSDKSLEKPGDKKKRKTEKSQEQLENKEAILRNT